jgi:FLVCR family MFS transporter 7
MPAGRAIAPFGGSTSIKQRPTRTILANALNGDNGDSDEELEAPKALAYINHPMRSVEPQVFPQRWVQLGYLSALALLSDWICFSVAANPDTYESVFHHSAASLIDMFLFTNVASSFLVTDVVAKIGLQKAIQGAAVTMTVGCWLRSGFSFLPMTAESEHLMTYPFIVIGTIMVGAAQPFFQCTPPFLSATWFAPSERATSTAVALNFNQIGIAVAFLVGGEMASDRMGLETYFGLIAVICTAVMAGTLLQFENEPPVPPSASELEKKIRGEKEPPFLESVQKFFKTRGFTKALAAFVCSISITNVVGAFIDEVLERGGITEQFHIDLAGAGFELAILTGGILIGGYVDRTKEYKKVTLACLGLTAASLIPLGLTEHAIGQEPILLILSLLFLGVAAGPIQPINAELAVDVTYPGDETAVESVQQIGGNLISALLIPIAELASKRDYQVLPNIPWAASDIRGDVILLVTIALLTMGFFSSFDAPLLRTAADEDNEDNEVSKGVPHASALPQLAEDSVTEDSVTNSVPM